MITRRHLFLPWVRMLLGVLTFFAAGFLAISKTLSPAPPIALLVIVTAVLVVIGAVLPTLEDFRFGRALAVEQEVVNALRGGYSYLVETKGFSPVNLRLHFFRVGRVWQFGWPLRVQALVRVGYFAIKSTAPLADVCWTKGKGMIGQVWADRDIAGRAVDVRVDPGSSNEDWATVPAADRRGMAREEAIATKHVETVFAAAILESNFRGKVVGVISADTIEADRTKFDDAGAKAFLIQTGGLAWRTLGRRG